MNLLGHWAIVMQAAETILDDHGMIFLIIILQKHFNPWLFPVLFIDGWTDFKSFFCPNGKH